MTYKQIVETILSLASTNLAVASVGFGEGFEVNRENDILYPHFYLEQAALVSVENGRETYQLNYQLLDRSLEGLSNKIDILSKAKHTIETITFKLLRENEEWFIEPTTWTLLPFQEAYQDRVYGWRMEITLEFPFLLSHCELPYLDPIVPSDDKPTNCLTV